MTTYTEADGRFSFDISYRRLGGDRGLSIKVRGPVADKSQELLRFDCFEESPHFHVEVYGKNEITAIEANDAVEWSLDKLDNEFEQLLNAAGSDPLTNEERENFKTTMNRVQERSLNLVAAETAS